MNVPVDPIDLLLDEAQSKAALGMTVLHCYPKLHPTHARTFTLIGYHRPRRRTGRSRAACSVEATACYAHLMPLREGDIP